MSKIVLFAKWILFIFIILSIIGYMYIIMYLSNDFLSTQYYMPSKTYNIFVSILAICIITYIFLVSKKILYKIILLFTTLILYSFLTITIHGSYFAGYQNFMYPFIESKYIKLVGNGDYELSDCKINYLFYKVKNKYNKRFLFRGVTSIGVDHLCDKNINSPSYSKDAESDE